jgi:hypothetical protein
MERGQMERGGMERGGIGKGNGEGELGEGKYIGMDYFGSGAKRSGANTFIIVHTYTTINCCANVKDTDFHYRKLNSHRLVQLATGWFENLNGACEIIL